MNRPEIKVSLRICGDDLIPEEITQQLGCAPTEAHRKGECVRTGHFVRESQIGIWRLHGECEDGNLDSAITSLLTKIRSDLEVWNSLAHKYRIDIFCGIFLHTLNQGVSIQSITLEQLASRGIILSFDMYCNLDK